MSKPKTKFGTCEAHVQDEFPGWHDGNGSLVGGYITQVEIVSESDAGIVVAWFRDPELAEKVCELLNNRRGK